MLGRFCRESFCRVFYDFDWNVIAVYNSWPMLHSTVKWICMYIHLLSILMPWYKQAISELKGDKLSSSGECCIRIWEVWDTKSAADWIPTHRIIFLIRRTTKDWVRQSIVDVFSLHHFITLANRGSQWAGTNTIYIGNFSFFCGVSFITIDSVIHLI